MLSWELLPLPLLFLSAYFERNRAQYYDLQRAWRERLHGDRSAGLLYGIVDLLFENPIIAAGDLTGRFGVTHRTAMLNLRKLA